MLAQETYDIPEVFRRLYDMAKQIQRDKEALRERYNLEISQVNERILEAMRCSDAPGTQFARRPSSMMKISVHQQSGEVRPIVELQGSRNYSCLSSLSRITPRPLSNVQKQTVRSQK